MPTVAEQLASVWNYISGAGTNVENRSIWVWRDGEWLMYAAWVPKDEIGFFRYGDVVNLYAAQDCVLTYKGLTVQLHAGWNELLWPIHEEPPAGWMGMLMPIMMIGMMGAMMWPMIKGLFKKDK